MIFHVFIEALISEKRDRFKIHKSGIGRKASIASIETVRREV